MIKRYFFPILLFLVLGAALWVVLRPPRITVDLGRVERGDIRVTVDEDGRTRVRERYVVTTPLAGRMDRIALNEGDDIRRGETILVRLDASDPSLLDARTTAELEARVRAAQAAMDRMSAQRIAASAAMEFAQTEAMRVETASRDRAVAPREIDDANLAVTLRTQEAHAAEFAVQIAKFELEQAQAALGHASPRADDSSWTLAIPSPIDGRVLRVLRDSAGFVGAGTPLLEVGDPQDLEIEVDVLSADAVRVRPGAPVRIERWGGGEALSGIVRTVEPSGFTKISALGVEEQRVNVIIDFAGDPAARRALGDGFRIEASITVEERWNVLRAPTGAFFRYGGRWCAYRRDGERAVRVAVDLGARTDHFVEVLGGIDDGAEVVLYPSDRIQDGVRVVGAEAPGAP